MAAGFSRVIDTATVEPIRRPATVKELSKPVAPELDVVIGGMLASSTAAGAGAVTAEAAIRTDC